MDKQYIPELSILLTEKDINDAIYELQTESKRLNNDVNSLIATTEQLKMGWNTTEGVIATDKIRELTSALEKITKSLVAESNNIYSSIDHEII